MFNGNIYFTNDMNIIQQARLHGDKIVALSEDQAFIKQIGALSGSVLLPPYDVVCAEMNGDMDAYINLYDQYLSSYECTAFLGAIFQALRQGINICLYVPQEMADLSFGSFIKEYLTHYGIFIEDQGTIYQFNIESLAQVVATLYITNYITVNELMLTYPKGFPFFDDIIFKLRDELNPYVPVQDLPHYAAYFNGMKDNSQNNGQFLRDGIQFGGE